MDQATFMFRTGFMTRRKPTDDRAGLMRLYELHGAAAYGLGIRLAASEEAAEEVVQRCFIELWELRSELAAAEIPKRTWLLEAVRRRSLGLPAQVLRAGPAGDGSISPEAVRGALSSLPADLRELLHEVAFERDRKAPSTSRRQLPLAELRHQLRIGLEKLASGIEGQLESRRVGEPRAAGLGWTVAPK